MALRKRKDRKKKNMDDATKKLLSGHVRIEEIQEIPARTVRVFLNSAAEGRKTLTYVYPFCVN